MWLARKLAEVGKSETEPVRQGRLVNEARNEFSRKAGHSTLTASLVVPYGIDDWPEKCKNPLFQWVDRSLSFHSRIWENRSLVRNIASKLTK